MYTGPQYRAGIISVWVMLFMTVNQSSATEQPMSFSHQAINHQGIRIYGSAAFNEQVQSCLTLLSEKAPDDLGFVRQFIGEIKQHNKSGMVAWAEPPRYEMSSKTAFYSTTWCAGTIAHDAFHSHLYQQHKKDHSGRLLYRLWAGFKAEALAIQYQIQVAERIGAPHSELNYLRSLKGTHSDLDGDKIITSKDYQQRDW